MAGRRVASGLPGCQFACKLAPGEQTAPAPPFALGGGHFLQCSEYSRTCWLRCTVKPQHLEAPSACPASISVLRGAAAQVSALNSSLGVCLPELRVTAFSWAAESRSPRAPSAFFLSFFLRIVSSDAPARSGGWGWGAREWLALGGRRGAGGSRSWGLAGAVRAAVERWGGRAPPPRDSPGAPPARAAASPLPMRGGGGGGG